MICGNCDTANPPNSRFCTNYKVPFTHQCGECRAFGPDDMDCCDSPLLDILTIGAGVVLGLVGFEFLEDMFD